MVRSIFDLSDDVITSGYLVTAHYKPNMGGRLRIISLKTLFISAVENERAWLNIDGHCIWTGATAVGNYARDDTRKGYVEVLGYPLEEVATENGALYAMKTAWHLGNTHMSVDRDGTSDFCEPSVIANDGAALVVYLCDLLPQMGIPETNIEGIIADIVKKIALAA
jgi:hypothetical protein